MSLSTLIVQREIATIREVEEALARQVLYGGDLVTNLLEVCQVEETSLMLVVAEAFGLPPAPSGELPAPSVEAQRLVAPEVASERNLAALSLDRAGLVVAVAEPLSREVEQELAFALAMPITQRVAPLFRIREALARDYGLPIDRRFHRLLSRLLGDTGMRPSSVPTMHAPAELRSPPRPPSAMPEMPKRRTAAPARRVVPGSDAPSAPKTLVRDREVPPARPQRRRRGPLTADVARRELEEAGERDTIFDLVFEFARQFFDYTALFTVHGETAEGRDAYGDGASREHVARISVPLDAPNILAMAIAQKTTLVKTPAPDGVDAVLYKDLGRRGGTECVVLPIVVRKRVVALLLGDGGSDGVEPKSLSEVKKVVDKASMAFERMIVRRKLKGGAAEERSAAAGAEAPSPEPSANEDVAGAGESVERDVKDRLAVRHGAGAKADAVAAARHALPLVPFPGGMPITPAPPVEVSDRPSVEELAAPIRELMNEPSVNEPERSPLYAATALTAPAPPPAGPVHAGLTLDPASLFQPVTIEPGPLSNTASFDPAPIPFEQRFVSHGVSIDPVPISKAVTIEPAAHAAVTIEPGPPAHTAPSPAEASLRTRGAAVTIQPAHNPAAVVEQFEPLPNTFSEQDSLAMIDRGRSDDPPPPTNILAVRRPSGAPIPREEPEAAAREAPPPSRGPAHTRVRTGAHRRAQAPRLDFAATRTKAPAFGSEAFGVDDVERRLLAEIEGRAPVDTSLEAPVSQAAPPTQANPVAEARSPWAAPASAPASPRAESPQPMHSAAPTSLASDAVALAERAAADLSPMPLALSTRRAPSSYDPEATPIAPEIDPDPTPIAPSYVLSVGTEPVSVRSPNAPLVAPAAQLPAVAVATTQGPSTAPAQVPPASPRQAWPFPVSARPMPPSEQQISVAPHRPPTSRNDETRALPSVIVDVASQYVALVERVAGGIDDEAESELLRAGGHAMPAIMAKFPGPLTVEEDRLADGVWPRASECGPVLRLAASQRRTALPFVLACAADVDVDKRFWATYLLSELVYADAIEPAFQRVFDEEPRVRRAARLAARALAEAYPAAVVERLVAVANHPAASRARRLLAVEALGETREPLAVPALVPLLDDGSREVAAETRRSLTLVTRQDFGDSRSKWDTWWRENGDRHRLEWLIDSLMHDQAVLRAAAGEELKTITKEYFGYYDDLPKRERERAQARYREWWNSVGHVRFNRDAARGA